jgi:hypothetical protein
MPMPSSGEISFLNLKNEWGDTDPIAFSDYYRNGTFIDANDYGPSIPSSGEIALSHFYGAYKVDLAAVLNQYNAITHDIQLLRTASNFLPNLASASVGINLYNDGSAIYYYATHNIGTTNFTSFTWKTGGGGVGDYYAYMYSPSGDSFTSSGGLDTALQLNTSRGWELTASSTSGTVFKELTSTLQIRTAGGSVLASRTLKFTVEADSS